MATITAPRRKQPFIYVTWLRNYLIGDNLCRWSIWHRIYHQYEAAKSDFDSVHYNMEHSTFRHETQQRYIKEGYEVIPEMPVTIYGDIAVMKGKIDLVAIREGRNLIIEVKTGKPRAADKIQLMLYIWGLPKTYSRFRGVSFDGLLVYKVRWSSLNRYKTLSPPFVFTFQFHFKFQRTFVAQT